MISEKRSWPNTRIRVFQSALLNAFIAFGATFITSVSVHAQTNLLINPSFENGGGTSYRFEDGQFSLNGWTGRNSGFVSIGRRDTNPSDGTYRWYMGDGSRLETRDISRPAAIPGRLYELQFDLRTTKNNRDYTGTLASIRFYNSSGTLIQTSQTQELQDVGLTTDYETIVHRAIAPAEAVAVGIKVEYPRSEGSQSDFRRCDIDNFKLYLVTEEDKVAIRRAPKLIEPGKTAELAIKYGAAIGRQVAVRLLKSGVSQGEVRQTVAAGRGVATVSYPIPGGAAEGTDYEWQVRMLPISDDWDNFLDSQTTTGVFLDETVSGSGNIAADNSNIVYTGRWDMSNATAPKCYWPGSQIRARFNGTSLSVRMGRPADENDSITFEAFLNGDTQNPIRFSIGGTNQTRVIATGLADTTHTVVIHRQTGPRAECTFSEIILDSGKGLLKPEPEADRKFEFYGDSITEGAAAGFAKTASPNLSEDGDYNSSNFYTYAGVTSRELGASYHALAQGGTGISGSFSGLPTLAQYWNLLNYANNNTGSATTWTFSQYATDVIVIAIGHNDLFQKVSQADFNAKYAQLIADLHAAHPGAHIFCTNTVMSVNGSEGQWQRAIQPLLDTDPLLHFQLFRPNQDHNGHPKMQDHRGMALGEGGASSSVSTNRQWGPGLVEWIEETMGWGIGYGTLAAPPPEPPSTLPSIEVGEAGLKEEPNAPFDS